MDDFMMGLIAINIILCVSLFIIAILSGFLLELSLICIGFNLITYGFIGEILKYKNNVICGGKS